jgi:hypothetical protein
MTNKLDNFPSVYVITIPENSHRILHLKNDFAKYGLDPKCFVYKKYKNGDYDVRGAELFAAGHTGSITSFFQTLKSWYDSTSEEYALFCDDDLSLESVSYWNFTWSDFMNKLPENWNCIQLSVLKEDAYYNDYDLSLKSRFLYDWGGTMLVKREHAKKLLDAYYYDSFFDFFYKGSDLDQAIHHNAVQFPNISKTVENIVFTRFETGGVYSVPLFLENYHLFGTCMHSDGFIIGTESTNALCHTYLLNWWKNGGLDLDTIKYPYFYQKTLD